MAKVFISFQEGAKGFRFQSLKEEAAMSEQTKTRAGANDPTKIDLGDDLLQTRTVEHVARAQSDIRDRPTSNATVETGGVEELLVNAKILVTEGFLDEAKLTLRRVLRMDPANLTARERLEEIQKTEIRRLLGQEENPRTSFLQSRRKPAAPDESADSVLLALEHEIGTSPTASDEFFKTPADLQVFLTGIDQLCVGASAQDRIDLGVGFMGMELYDVAIRQFQVAIRDAELEKKARGLLATALVTSGQYFNAMIEIESLVADQSSTAEEKIDYGYLAGVAQEGLKNPEAAARWYRAVLQIDPEYRDTAERMQIVQAQCAKVPS